MKRFLAIVLALVMVLSLVACGGTSAQQPNDGQNAGVEADANVDAAAPAVTDGATLTVKQLPLLLIPMRRLWAPR